jgi:hypothetical protein
VLVDKAIERLIDLEQLLARAVLVRQVKEQMAMLHLGLST